MPDANIEREYTRLLDEKRARGELSEFGGAEHRVHPRLKVHSPRDLWISTVPEFSLVDMSASGLSFLSNHTIPNGEMLHISLGQALSVDAEVVACVMEEPPSEYTDPQFRVHCRFLEDYEGMELLVETIRLSS